MRSARASASASVSGSTASWSRSVSATPRSSWDKMTPELPRAPMSEPWAIAWQTSPISADAGFASSSATTEATVRDMFVPVSPSGTG